MFQSISLYSQTAVRRGTVGD